MRPALLALTLPLTAATAPVTTPLKRCAYPTPDTVAAREPARVRPLAAMPPAKLLLGVYNEVDGCPRPIVVRAQVGAPRR